MAIGQSASLIATCVLEHLLSLHIYDILFEHMHGQLSKKVVSLLIAPLARLISYIRDYVRLGKYLLMNQAACLTEQDQGAT
jgi:hypothetical protein